MTLSVEMSGCHVDVGTISWWLMRFVLTPAGGCPTTLRSFDW